MLKLALAKVGAVVRLVLIVAPLGWRWVWRAALPPSDGSERHGATSYDATTPRRHDATTPRRHDATTPRRHDATTPRRHDAENGPAAPGTRSLPGRPEESGGQGQGVSCHWSM
ncbi:hypothetical protein [Streptomyces sp. YIM S03343]